MVRKLKYHEQKLLKKVDFLNVSTVTLTTIHPIHPSRTAGQSSDNTCLQWKQDANLREIKVMRRYHIQEREDYHKYSPIPPILSPLLS